MWADDLKEICLHLKHHGITSVAMESTGSYWQNLYVELVEHGFEVTLCNGKFTKNIRGKKTDMKDARWIQKLHAIGLLTGSFLPDETTETLRTYCRQRSNWVDLSAEASNKMQKYLKLLNYRLDVVVRDVCGLTGLSIIADICKGNLDPEKLSELRHGNCKKSKEEIAKALNLFFQKKINDCDKPHKRINKNAIKGIDLNQVAYQYFGGIDLMRIEGVNHSTIMSIMSEVGPDGFEKFPTAKHFTSWLRLAPNNKISGGKLLSSKTPKGSNRLKIALRNAANAIGNLKDTHLSDFFRRIAFKKGRTAAVSATARKLAVIIWKMIVNRI